MKNSKTNTAIVKSCSGLKFIPGCPEKRKRFSEVVHIIFSALLLICISCLELACNSTVNEKDRVVLQINWFHAPEFIGYYIADTKGFYKEKRIQCIINEGGSGLPARESILNGKADFAISSFSEQKKLVENNQPSIAIMSVFQIPPLVIFALVDSGIKEPRDLIGKRIGIKNEYWREIMRQTLLNAGIDPQTVIEIKVPVNAQELLYSREVDVWMGYLHDEPIAAEMAGYKVKNIYPADYGIGGYEGLLLVNQSTINQKTDMVSRFVGASQRGLQYALEHPDEAASIMRIWQPDRSLEYYKKAIRAIIPLVDIPQSKVGWIDPVRWAQLMGSSYDVERPGYSMQFLMNLN